MAYTCADDKKDKMRIAILLICSIYGPPPGIPYKVWISALAGVAGWRLIEIIIESVSELIHNRTTARQAVE
jgi:hypothetical protein